MLPDNRLQFPPTKINFAEDVGLTGQLHDSFPGPNQQPRFDWLLSWFIALLANQSSYNEPMQYRSGTLWFDLNTNTLKIWIGSVAGGQWQAIAESVAVPDALGNAMPLTQWVTAANLALSGSAPVVTFGGECISPSNTEINIPVPLQQYINIEKTRPFVYINGLLIDPRNCAYYTAATVVLKNDAKLNSGDTFTVVIMNILPQLFNIPSVQV